MQHIDLVLTTACPERIDEAVISPTAHHARYPHKALPAPRGLYKVAVIQPHRPHRRGKWVLERALGARSKTYESPGVRIGLAQPRINRVLQRTFSGLPRPRPWVYELVGALRAPTSSYTQGRGGIGGTRRRHSFP